MASASLEPEKIRESILKPKIPKIHGTPHYFSISEAHVPLNKNATSIYPSRGNPALGNYTLTASDAEYFLSAGVNFVRPVNPGVHPFLTPGATATQIAHQKREHEEHIREFRVLQASDNGLKNLLVNAVDAPYIKDLRDRVTG